VQELVAEDIDLDEVVEDGDHVRAAERGHRHHHDSGEEFRSEKLRRATPGIQYSPAHLRVSMPLSS
jgi:hypothetical protein